MRSYMETTADPSQVTPFHDSAQGSPPLLFQLVNCEGLFNEVYMTCRACTEKGKIKLDPKTNQLPEKGMNHLLIC